MDEEQNNAMQAFVSVVESRANKRGSTTEKPTKKNELNPREVKRIIVKNYYRKVISGFSSLNNNLF